MFHELDIHSLGGISTMTVFISENIPFKDISGN